MPNKRKRTPLTFLRFAYNETVIYAKVKKMEKKLGRSLMELGVASYNHQKKVEGSGKKVEELTNKIDRITCEINECFVEMRKRSIVIKYGLDMEK